MSLGNKVWLCLLALNPNEGCGSAQLWTFGSLIPVELKLHSWAQPTSNSLLFSIMTKDE